MGKDPDHVAELNTEELHKPGKDEGCVFYACGQEGHIYRENCYDYTKANLASHYNVDFTSGGNKDHFDTVWANHGRGQKKFARSTKRDPRYTAQAWYIGMGPYSSVNFQIGSYRWPWTNYAHHVLPYEIVHSLTYDELKVLLQAKYNMNAGINLIFLPHEEIVGEIMHLYTHPNNHGTYSTNVKTQLNNLRADLAQARDPEEEGHGPVDEEGVPELQKKMEDWSKRQRQELYDGGKTFGGQHVSTATVLSMNPKNT